MNHIIDINADAWMELRRKVETAQDEDGNYVWIPLDCAMHPQYCVRLTPETHVISRQIAAQRFVPVPEPQ